MNNISLEEIKGNNLHQQACSGLNPVLLLVGELGDAVR